MQVNSKLIWCPKKPLNVNKTKSFDFVWQLVVQIIKPFIRSRNINGLPRIKLDRMERILDKKNQANPLTKGNTSSILTKTRMERRRCKQCQKESSKNEKSNLPKTKEKCELCGMVIC